MTKVDVAFKKKKSFTNVANSAIRDDKLSPEAKGVYAIIQSWITFEAEDFICSKSFIFKKSNCGEKKFDRIWNELKQAGYLKMYCVGKANWTAELLDEAKPEEAHTYYLNNDGEVTYTNVEIAEKKAANKAASENTEDEEDEEDASRIPQKGGTLENGLRNPQKRGTLKSSTLERDTLTRGILEGGNNINTSFKNSFNNSFYNNQSINQSEAAEPITASPLPTNKKIDRLIDKKIIDMNLLEDIKEQIQYDVLCDEYKHNPDDLDIVVSILAEFYTATEPQTFDNRTFSADFVNKRSLAIDRDHVDYVFECFKQQRDKVYNVRKYLRSAIFNAPDTFGAYITNKVRVDGVVW